MLEVVPPKGWIAPQPANVSDSQPSKDLTDSGSLGGDFEDIEHLLAKPQATPAAQGKKSKSSKSAASPLGKLPPPPNRARTGPRSRTPGADNRAASAAPTGTDGPILPTDQWTGESTRKRKQIVRTVVGVLGSLLLLAAVLTAVILNLSKPKQNAANNGQPPATDANALGNNDPAIVNPDNRPNRNDVAGGPLANLHPKNDADDLADNDLLNVPREQDQAPNAPQWNGVGPAPIEANAFGMVDPPKPLNNPRFEIGDAAEDPVSPDPVNRDPVNRDPVNRDPDTERENDLPAPKIAGGISLINPPPLPEAAQDGDQKVDPKSPFDAAAAKQEPKSPFKVEPPPDKPNPPVGIVEELENDLGELSNLLEQRGTSLSDFKDVASQINNQHLIGLPKYVVVPADPISDLDLEKRLEYPIGGLIFDATPLAGVLRKIETISGIPISIDARSIVLVGKDPNPQVTIKISDTDVAGALGQILASLGLSQQNNPSGISVGNFGSQAMSNAEFELPEIPNVEAADRQRLVATIREFIEPEAWVREENPATIELVDNTVVVNCSEEMQAQIGVLISKLKSARALIEDPANINAIANTKSRWKSLSPLLAKEPNLSHSIQSEIGTFLNRLESKTGLALLVDWTAVSSEGWSPQTIVPGNIQESSVLDTALQLAQAMQLAILAVNENTMVMTTFDRSAEMVDLEVYPVGKILAGSLSEKQMMKLIENALGNQLQSKFVRYMFQPSCQCVIVLGPQTVQRQIEALLDQLDGI
jgi:hypothetical protein